MIQKELAHSKSAPEDTTPARYGDACASTEPVSFPSTGTSRKEGATVSIQYVRHPRLHGATCPGQALATLSRRALHTVQLYLNSPGTTCTCARRLHSALHFSSPPSPAIPCFQGGTSGIRCRACRVGHCVGSRRRPAPWSFPPTPHGFHTRRAIQPGANRDSNYYLANESCPTEIRAQRELY